MLTSTRQPAPTPAALKRVIRSKAVCSRTGLSRISVWRKARDPNDSFPAAVQLGSNSIGWFEDEIDRWLAERPRLVAVA